MPKEAHKYTILCLDDFLLFIFLFLFCTESFDMLHRLKQVALD